MSAGRRFRKALAEERPLQIAGAINAYAALLAERAGFRAIYLSGAGRGERVVRIARSRDDHVERCLRGHPPHRLRDGCAAARRRRYGLGAVRS